MLSYSGSYLCLSGQDQSSPSLRDIHTLSSESADVQRALMHDYEAYNIMRWKRQVCNTVICASAPDIGIMPVALKSWLSTTRQL